MFSYQHPHNPHLYQYSQKSSEPLVLPSIGEHLSEIDLNLRSVTKTAPLDYTHKRTRQHSYELYFNNKESSGRHCSVQTYEGRERITTTTSTCPITLLEPDVHSAMNRHHNNFATSTMIRSTKEQHTPQMDDSTTFGERFSGSPSGFRRYSSSPETPQVGTPTATPKSTKTIQLSKEDIEKYFSFPQPKAAKLLGVSLSTLKRRFYDTHKGSRWPYSGIKKQAKKRSIAYIMNQKNKPVKLLDPHTLHTLKKAFAGCAL